MFDFENIPLGCKSIFGFLALVQKFLGENFSSGGIDMEHGASKSNFTSSGFICTTLWLYSDPEVTAVTQIMFVLQRYLRNELFEKNLYAFICKNSLFKGDISFVQV